MASIHFQKGREEPPFWLGRLYTVQSLTTEIIFSLLLGKTHSCFGNVFSWFSPRLPFLKLAHVTVLLHTSKPVLVLLQAEDWAERVMLTHPWEVSCLERLIKCYWRSDWLFCKPPPPGVDHNEPATEEGRSFLIGSAKPPARMDPPSSIAGSSSILLGRLVRDCGEKPEGHPIRSGHPNERT